MPDLWRVAFLGGVLTMDRSAGWGLMLGQPLVGACLAGAFIQPGTQWELWALRIPLGVGVLLQLILTEPSLPAAQRSRDGATAGVIGASVALYAMEQLHPLVPISTGGILWVVVGVATGLLAAVGGGWIEAAARRWNGPRAERADELAREGRIGAFEALYWGAVVRIFLRGAAWTAIATFVGVTLAATLLPRIAGSITGPRIGLAFAVLLGMGFGAGYHAHVRGRSRGLRWATLGALTAIVLLFRIGGGAP